MTNCARACAVANRFFFFYFTTSLLFTSNDYETVFFFFTVQVINYKNIEAYLYSFYSLYAKCSWIIKEFITGRVLDISLMYLQLPSHLSFIKH